MESSDHRRNWLRKEGGPPHYAALAKTLPGKYLLYAAIMPRVCHNRVSLFHGTDRTKAELIVTVYSGGRSQPCTLCVPYLSWMHPFV